MSTSKHTFSRINFFISLVICLLAAYFRLTNLEFIEYKSDEAINIFLLTRPLFGHPFPPGSTVSSLGILNPPLFLYILFPFSLISYDPRFLSGVIGTFNVLAIGGLFLILMHYYNRFIAIVASMLFAVSPWAIILSRKIWTPELLIPFLVLLLLSLHKILLDGKMNYWILAILSSSFLIQLHQSSLFFLLPLYCALLLAKVKLNRKALLIGCFIALVPLLPYVSYEISNNCPDCSAFLGASEKVSANNSIAVFLRMLQVPNQGNFSYLFGTDIVEFANENRVVFFLRRILYVEYILIPVGIYLFWKRHQKLRPLIYATVVLPLLYFFFKIEPIIHYFLILLPLLFLFLAYVLYWLYQRNRITKILSIFLIISLLTESVFFMNAFFAFVREKKSLQGDFGSTYAAQIKSNKISFDFFRIYPEGEEMILTSQVPKDAIIERKPLSSMLYNHRETEQRLKSLEILLQKNPDDPRILNELLAYYTYNPVTKKTFKSLQNKARQIPGYKTIISTIYPVYLGRNLKKSVVFDDKIVIEYPQHWEVKKNSEDLLVLKVDYYLFVLQKTSSMPELFSGSPVRNIYALDQSLKRHTCIDHTTWCGEYFEQIKLENIYKLSYEPDQLEPRPIYTNKEVQTIIQIMDSVTQSMEIVE